MLTDTFLYFSYGRLLFFVNQMIQLLEFELSCFILFMKSVIPTINSGKAWYTVAHFIILYMKHPTDSQLANNIFKVNYFTFRDIKR